MKIISFLTLVCVVTATAGLAYAAGPSDKFARNAFQEILSQVDTNKDGKLSLPECKAMWKDATTAEKNCTFWDANHDGIITEDEYVAQGMSKGKKKNKP